MPTTRSLLPSSTVAMTLSPQPLPYAGLFPGFIPGPSAWPGAYWSAGLTSLSLVPSPSVAKGLVAVSPVSRSLSGAGSSSRPLVPDP